MKKLNEVHKYTKEKKRCISVLPYKYHYKIINNKQKKKCNNFLPSKTSSNFYFNKDISKNKSIISDSLTNDIKKNQYLNHASKTSNLDIKDIDIIKEQQNDKLIFKISNFLKIKKEKVSLLKKLNEPKVENLKRRLYESKSEQDILAKTFSTKFINSDKHKQLLYAFEKGHSKKIGDNLQYKRNISDANFRKKQSDLYKMNHKIAIDDKGLLNSLKSLKSRNIYITTKEFYYNNQYDSYNSLMINKNLYNQIVLNQEKEQIKQFLKKELVNEQTQFINDLMPKIKTIELSKFKKEPKANNFLLHRRAFVNSIFDLSKIPRENLFSTFKFVYLKNISKFLSTPTCREGATMFAYLDEENNNYKLFLFGGMNVIRLNDLWECNVINPNRLDKKYIWKKVEFKGAKPFSRNGHSMVFYRNNLVIYGGIIEEKMGIRVKEDLLCYDILEKKFSVEVCSNKFAVTWRSFHIAEILGQYMFIYGGGDESGNILAEPWALDLERMRWEPAKFNTDILPKRKFHCSCQVFPPQKKYHPKFSLFKVYTEPGLFNSTKILVEGIYIFGGIDENYNCSNDVFIIKRGRPLQLFKAITKGKPPIPRCECTMNFFERLDILIIYGGKNDHSRYGPYFNDMYFLDVETLHWIKIELNYNENFQPRGRHCSCIVENEIIIFGGNNENFLLKSDLLIGNLDIGESTKIMRTSIATKYKNKFKKDKVEFANNLEKDNKDNMNNEEGKEEIKDLEIDDEIKTNDLKRRASITSLDTEKILNLDPISKIKKDTKIIMNQKVQTSKNFFLDFPEQRNELQEKFKEIDAINLNSTDKQKIQDIIKERFNKYNIN